MNEPHPGPPAHPASPRRPLAAPTGTPPAQPAPHAAAVPAGGSEPALAHAHAEPAHAHADEPAHGDEPATAEPHVPAPDDGPQPLGLRVEPTGHPPVDAQLRRLEDADHLAVSGHLEVYEDVHRDLRDTLTALDRHDPRPQELNRTWL